MFSKKTVILLSVIFLFLSIMALVVNMPEHKDRAVMEKLKPYIPYELTKTMGGLDIIDKKTGKKMKIDNAKVFIALDEFTKRWGKEHLRLENDTLFILDDANKTIDQMKLTPSQQSFIHKFFKK